MAPDNLAAGINQLRRKDSPNRLPALPADAKERSDLIIGMLHDILIDPTAHFEYDLNRLLEIHQQDVAALSEFSYKDQLTGMLNRRGYDTEAPKLLDVTRRLEGHLLYVLADVDRFKQVNDTYGHSAGDAVLGAFGKASRDILRSGDLACRLGGDEFVFLLPSAKIPGKEVITRLDRRYHEILAERRILPVSISYGHATYEDDVLSMADHARMPAEAVLERLKEIADSRMYCTKRSAA